jgi:S-formylglutathione hydrolase FrmB
MSTNVTIILPSFDQNYDLGKPIDEIYSQNNKFPVLWLLHGGSGDDADYLNWTNVARYAVEYNCAVVCPCDYNAAYSDYPRGAKYYSYITDELRAFCLARFPFSDKREDNFIGGLSMGSGGAMKIAMDRCEQYSVGLIMSGGIPPKNRTPSGHANFREKVIAAGWPMPKQPRDVVRPNTEEMVRKNVTDGRPLPKMIFACGEEDNIAYVSSVYGSQLMAELGYDVTSFTLPGYRHEWDFWEICMRKAFSEWLPCKKKTTSETSGAWSDPVQK